LFIGQFLHCRQGGSVYSPGNLDPLDIDQPQVNGQPHDGNKGNKSSGQEDDALSFLILP